MQSPAEQIQAMTLPREVFAHGFSLRKRPILRSFARGSEVHFIRDVQRVPAGSTLLLWGSRSLPTGLQADIAVVRVEDGFLRSVGLGAALVRPISWVMDTRGIYYDATRSSDLEHLLQTSEFSQQLLARAGLLRAQIETAQITKYNVGLKAWCPPSGATRTILVPGQVESDASLSFGTTGIRTNIELLQTVRRANPSAYVLYKTHPDVSAGLRASGKGEHQAGAWCDEVVSDVAMGVLLPKINEVHVMTSLTGFEALLRHKAVTCYGEPFYAGWGLTRDRRYIGRRTRRLTLDELVAGVLLLYPRYLNRLTGRPTTAEHAVSDLAAWRSSVVAGVPPWQHFWHMVLRIVGEST
jgi:capsular polysaccharide export protein